MAQSFTHQATIVHVGDTIRIHQEIAEGEKKRLQVFEGVVIAIKNRGQGQSFTVRKIATGGIGVEKIIPVMMPSIKKIEVKRKGNVRRAKLYFLRDRVGKGATKVKEKAVFAKTAPAVKK
ncbi:MAG: 50S ribosomal protein L19 [Patescibacteria group bacterium]